MRTLQIVLGLSLIGGLASSRPMLTATLAQDERQATPSETDVTPSQQSPGVRTFRVANADAEGIAMVIHEVLPGRDISLRADHRQGVIIAQGAPDSLLAIADLVQALDVARPVSVVEASRLLLGNGAQPDSEQARAAFRNPEFARAAENAAWVVLGRGQDRNSTTRARRMFEDYRSTFKRVNQLRKVLSAKTNAASGGGQRGGVTTEEITKALDTGEAKLSEIGNTLRVMANEATLAAFQDPQRFRSFGQDTVANAQPGLNELEIAVEAAADKYRAQYDQDKPDESLERALREAVERLFSRRQSLAAEQLQQMRKELRAIETSITERDKQKEKIIARQMQDLLARGPLPGPRNDQDAYKFLIVIHEASSDSNKLLAELPALVARGNREVSWSLPADKPSVVEDAAVGSASQFEKRPRAGGSIKVNWVKDAVAELQLKAQQTLQLRQGGSTLTWLENRTAVVRHVPLGKSTTIQLRSPQIKNSADLDIRVSVESLGKH